ncbi:hypothetical protein, partial [Faecalibacterium prausnitzii]|uniref:hypothetical protein n=1 Tax=Faecalibacterium prausnitzii TaxID=853 RepID=UPI002108E4B9
KTYTNNNCQDNVRVIVFKIPKASKAIVGRNAFLTFTESARARPSNKKPTNRFNVWSKKLNENGNNT